MGKRELIKIYEVQVHNPWLNHFLVEHIQETDTALML